MQDPEVQSAIGTNASPANDKDALVHSRVPSSETFIPEVRLALFHDDDPLMRIHKVSKQVAISAEKTDIAQSPDAAGNDGEENAGMLVPSTSSTYQPPYQPRIKNGSAVLSPALFPSAALSQALSNDFSLTFHATLSRQPHDGPLPFSQPHMELRLAWPEPKWFKWVPGRKWVPDVSLKYVEGGEREMVVRRPEAEKRGMIRGLVKSVVQSLPVVWRLARWF